jgi:hypothetical protein
MPVMITSSEGEIFDGFAVLSFTRLAQVGFGRALAIAPFRFDAKCLRLELLDGRVESAEQIGALGLSHKLVIMVGYGNFGVIEVFIVRENHSRFRLAPAVIEKLSHLPELGFELLSLLRRKLNVTSRISDFHFSSRTRR